MKQYITVYKNKIKNMHTCPRCKSKNTIRYGKTELNKQRYLCKDCKRTFIDTTGTTLSYSKKDKRVWQAYMKHLFQGKTIRECKEEVGISHVTSFVWRHKIISTMKNIQRSVRLEDKIQVHESIFRESFKGKKISNNFIRKDIYILGCIDEKKNLFMGGASKETIDNKKIHNLLSDRIKKNSIIYTRKMIKFNMISKHKDLKIIKAYGEFTDKDARLFSLSFKRFIRRYRGIASKYISFYINFFVYIINPWKLDLKLKNYWQEFIKLNKELRVLDLKNVIYTGEIIR